MSKFYFSALSDNAVWAEGLLVFYEIFRFLEDAMKRHKDDHIGKMHIDGIDRTEAFEKDLLFYLGSDWKKNYFPRDSVANYLFHLQKLEQNDHVRLIAYIYHLYMGLLSGGQILRGKRAIARKLTFKKKDPNQEGDAVTDFDGKPIYQLKKELVKAVNSVAETLDECERQSLLEESKVVFQLNNSIIHSVKGAGEVLLKKLLIYAMVAVCLMILYFSFIETSLF